MTVLSCMSIVVTAVYILRAIGKAVMGPARPETLAYKDAYWNEKLAAGVLMAGILVIGLTPFLLNDLIMPGTEKITEQLQRLTITR